MRTPNPFSLILFFLVSQFALYSADDNELKPNPSSEDIERYNNCRDVKFECGQQNMSTSYPFWGGDRPGYCGHPGYKLDCVDGFTQFVSMSTEYRVLNIDDQNKIMRTAYIGFLDDACPFEFSNATLNPLLFSFSGVILNLFYGCPKEITPPDRFASYKFKCQTNSSSGGNREDAYFLPPIDEMAEQLLPLLSLCYVNVQVPINGLDLARLTSNASLLVSILRGGFELNYSSAGAANFSFCDGCFESGGQCGFNSTLNRHTCFCRNGTANSQNFCRGATATQDGREINIGRYNSCRTVKFECEDQVRIGYPFWGKNRPDYCGLSGYKLDCENSHTQIEIMGTTYRVLKLDEGNKIMRIAKIEFLEDACPSEFSNSSLNFNNLFVGQGASNVNIFYGCPSEFGAIGGNPFKFKCQTTINGRTRDYAYFVPPAGIPFAAPVLSSSCDMKVEVPIMDSDLDKLTNNTALLEPILREGFELSYSSAAAANFTFCDRCFGSGGQCLFNSTLVQHTCFCANGTASAHTYCSSSASGSKQTTKIAIGVGAALGAFILACLAFLFLHLRRRRKYRRSESGRKKKHSKNLLSNADNPDLKIFKFKQLLIATNYFNESTKLGRGGFGSVYKGELPDGQVIAIKRLSKSSGQGSQEFKNEVVVISKLQHRNLVRLLGCCIAREEKILIYEYMPNNSLDTYLFVSDPTKRGLLDWRKRFQIIEGISRGILYLHRDSRLKVIHRDLKPSNVLLDEELNPKISDFGMARIFGSNELQGNTNRVVGTYGYMSPEYAMEGQFSEKSDVFSFGVLLLEIVSGRRNTSFYNHDQSSSLLKYAWLLWNENKIESLIEPMLSEELHVKLEIVRCIHVGLLCVQQFANDRPTMSTTLSMLTSEIATLPTPKQPAFTQELLSSHSSSHEHKQFSVNTITVTSVGGR